MLEIHISFCVSFALLYIRSMNLSSAPDVEYATLNTYQTCTLAPRNQYSRQKHQNSALPTKISGTHPILTLSTSCTDSQPVVISVVSKIMRDHSVSMVTRKWRLFGRGRQMCKLDAGNIWNFEVLVMILGLVFQLVSLSVFDQSGVEYAGGLGHRVILCLSYAC